MVAWLAWVAIAWGLALAAWGVVETIRGIRPSGALLASVAGLWVLLLLQGIGGAVAQFRADPAPDPVLFLGYFLTVVTVLPAGAFWGIADHSRWGNAVLAFTCATESVLVLRLLQIWGERA